MLGSVVVPLLVAVGLATVLPRMVVRLRPAAASKVLAWGAVSSAGAGLAALGLLSWYLFAAIPQVAALGRWRPAQLVAQSTVPLPLAAVATVVLVAIAARLARGVLAHAGDARDAVRLERRLPTLSRPPRLVFVDDPAPVAHAVTALPACGGHIVCSRALWERLNDRALRRAVLEHERAHLRHRHGLLLGAAELARLVNPLLGPTIRQLRFQLERWADEDAATATSRATVAQAVATVALSATQRFALGFHGASSTARIRALLDDEPSGRALPVSLLVVVLGVVATAATAWACHDTELAFEAFRRIATR